MLLVQLNHALWIALANHLYTVILASFGQRHQLMAGIDRL
jgi:hypothetical protein